MESSNENMWVSESHDSGRRFFKVLYAQYHGYLYNCAFQVLKNKLDAEDIVQDIFCWLWHNRSSIPYVVNMKGYLSKSVKNRISYLRRIRTRESTAVLKYTSQHLPGIVNSPTLHREHLYAAVGALSVAQRRIIVLKYFLGVPDKQIAEQLNLSHQHVRNVVSVAKKSLRNSIVKGLRTRQL